MQSFGQDMHLSPNGAIPDPALSHVYLSSIILFRMAFPDVEAEWAPRPFLVLYPPCCHGKPVRTLPVGLAGHKELWKFVLLASPLHTDCHARVGISFSLLLAQDKMGLLQNVVTRKCHNFSVKTNSILFCNWSYLHWNSQNKMPVCPWMLKPLTPDAAGNQSWHCSQP